MNAGTGKTAVITGASSGIGAEFAQQLAAQGYDLILVARRKHQLQSVAGEIRQRHPVKVGIVIADLSHLAGIKQVERRLGRRLTGRTSGQQCRVRRRWEVR